MLMLFVCSEITAALEMFGISPTEDMDMVAQIKNEVRKLCTRNNICAHISVNEAEHDKQENINRMIYRSNEDKVRLLSDGFSVLIRHIAGVHSGRHSHHHPAVRLKLSPPPTPPPPILMSKKIHLFI